MTTFSKLFVVGFSVLALGATVAAASDASADRAQLAASTGPSSKAAKPATPREGCGECCAKRASAAPATATDQG